MQPSQISGRKTSFGDYDSELVDGRYVTSVPILSPDDEDEMHGGNKRSLGLAAAATGGSISSRGNLRSEGSKGLRDLKRTPVTAPGARKSSIMDRLSSGAGGSGAGSGGRRATTNSSNVFDRLSGSRKALDREQDYQEESQQDSRRGGGGGTLSKIRDLTKTLRKGSREEQDQHSVVGGVVAPRDSSKLFDRRATTHGGELGNGTVKSNGVSNSATAGRTASPRTTRRATATISETWTIESIGLIAHTLLV